MPFGCQMLLGKKLSKSESAPHKALNLAARGVSSEQGCCAGAGPTDVDRCRPSSPLSAHRDRLMKSQSSLFNFILIESKDTLMG